MMHQDSVPWPDSRANVGRKVPNPVAVLAYRSRAVSPPTPADLDRLLADSQARNHTEGLTGLLVYDRGQYFQWLEGPAAALQRTWNSIRNDKRHTEIVLLREDMLPQRLFGNWDMRLARCKPSGIGELTATVDVPEQLLKQLVGKPVALADGSWSQLFADTVVPQLKTLHPALGSPQSILPASVRRRLSGSPVVWHASPDTSAELARVLMSGQSNIVARHVDSLLALGASVDRLYEEVFEPAQRLLGELWQDDQCNDLELTMALGKLQLEVRRIGAGYIADPSHFQGIRSVLMSPQPGEKHGVGLAMSSELFHRDGWDVTCEYPRNDQGVCDLVHHRWFDVLELSLSGALRRDYQLQNMQETIRAAHAASLNPALTVIVDGRTFFEKPLAYRDIAADAGCATASDGVRTADALLDALGVPSYQRAQFGGAFDVPVLDLTR